ncbi:endonuclease [Marivirga sp.]|uniref:endonuclease n=1 Tax=Marivirga sp. TaxID=2018662 RepID=UPI0025CE7D3A|nr:endonuclease [Marivirga sp.]
MQTKVKTQNFIRSIMFLFFMGLIYPSEAQIPSGYYDGANGKTGSQLKAALNDIISGHTTYPYSSSSTDVWDILKDADKDPNNPANVIGIYSGFSMDAAAEYNNGDGWNREHVWAKSRGDFGTMEGAGTDCHHLAVADISTNSARGNMNFSYGDTYYTDTQGFYSGSTLSKISSTEDVWEPRDEVKGDVARMLFYMATRYEGENGEIDLELTETLLSGTDKSPYHGKLSVLLEWHQQDPVSAAEIQRNDIIYSYQNNRNPFIDHPEYVCEIYSCSTSGGNNAPYFTSSPVTSVVAGSNYSYSITTTDPEGDNVNISATTLPTWMSFTDNGNGTAVISGSTQTSGDYSVSLNVSDGSASNTQNFTVSVTSSDGGTGTASELIFSEYIEGSSYNKGLEIANFTGSLVDLSVYSIMKQTNGSGSWSDELNLSGSITSGDVFVIVNSNAASDMQADADLITSSSVMSFNGNDPIGLFKNGQLIDVIGNFNSTSYFGQNTTLVRSETVAEPNTTYSTSEWDGYASDTFSYLGSHTISGTGTEDTEAPSIPSNILVSNVTETSFDLSWDPSTDNIGVDQYVIYLNGSFYANSSSTTATLNGLSASTNYVASISAQDAAGNESAQSTNVGVTTSAASPSIDCQSTINLFPYQQGFETGNDWIQSTSDNFDWTVNSGGTGSSNTGPSAAIEGSSYFYVESSSPNYSYKTATIESPCFDLSNESYAAFSFNYHMYGASTMGSLSLEITTDGDNWVSLWSKSGNQGTEWLVENIDLSVYLGKTIKLRFVGQTGDTWQGDMAIDKLELKNAQPPVETTLNLSLTFDNYPEETTWEIVEGSTVIASGGPYGNYSDGSTIDVSITVPEGCYDFNIYDSYGDGICCSYGNGSYVLSEGNNVFASGGSFGSGESTSFCVGSNLRSLANTESISSEIEAGGFNVYPNPAITEIKIFTGKMEATAYQIISLSGKIEQSGGLNAKSSTIDVTNLKSGLYILKVRDSENVVVRKIMVK